MPGGVAGGADTLREAVESVLMKEQHGVLLPTPVVGMLVSWLIDVEEVTDPERDMPKTPDDWMAIAEDAAEQTKHKKLTSMQRSHLTKWLGGKPLPTPAGLGAELPAAEKTAPETVGASAASATVTNVKIDRALAISALAELTVSDMDKETAIGDMIAQNLTGKSCQVFAMSLETGNAQPHDAFTGLLYRTDPRLTDVVKRMRKAGVDTLSSILSAKDATKLGAFFTTLMLELTAHGLTQEVALLSVFWSETLRFYSNNTTAMISYLESYFREYAGRGLPIKFDTTIALRTQGQVQLAAGPAAESLEKALKDLKAQFVEQKQYTQGLERTIRGMRSADPAGGRKTGEEAFAFAGTCNYCHKKGHKAADCPKLAAKKAKEEAGEDEE